MISQQLPEYLQKMIGNTSFNIEIVSIDIIRNDLIRLELSVEDSVAQDTMDVIIKDINDEDSVKGMIDDTMFVYSLEQI